MRLVFCGRYALIDIYHRNTVYLSPGQAREHIGRHSYPHGELSEEGYECLAISHFPPSLLPSFLFLLPFFFLFLLKEYLFKSLRNAALQTE